MENKLKFYELQCPNCLMIGTLKAYSPMMDAYECSSCKHNTASKAIYDHVQKTAKQELSLDEAPAKKYSKVYKGRTIQDIFRGSVEELLIKIKLLAKYRTKDATEVPDDVLDRLFETIFIQTDELLNVHYQGVNFDESYEPVQFAKEVAFQKSVEIQPSIWADVSDATPLDDINEQIKSVYEAYWLEHKNGGGFVVKSMETGSDEEVVEIKAYSKFSCNAIPDKSCSCFSCGYYFNTFKDTFDSPITEIKNA